MSLILSFRPGDRVSIGGIVFDIDTEAAALISEGGIATCLCGDEIAVAHNVMARIFDGTGLPNLVLAFTAPRDVAVVRIRSGDHL